MEPLKNAIGLFICLISFSFPSVRSDLFPLSIIHINDFHARFEPTDTFGGTCDDGEECIGGYARTVHTVRRLLEEQKELNPIYLNAGDSFQGTLWYNIGRWNVTSQFLNMLPADAMTIGNHEFDHKIEGLVPFLETINSPMLAANIDDSEEPTMQGLYEKSMIIERNGRKIGIIGVVLATFYDLADTGKLKFLNESDVIIEEAQKLKQQGANIIIALTHCGYDVDQIIAEHAGAEIDLIVGSHSHTFLYTGDVMPGPDTARGNYPTEVIHKASGHRVLIVQAAAYAKYVGNITLFFDDNGDVVSYEGAPIYMSKNVKEDQEVLQAIAPWKEIVDEKGNVIVGTSRVALEKWSCESGECNLGNFFADAMVHAFVNASTFDQPNRWTNVSIALVNAGALRVPLNKGNLTYAHVVTMSPFENALIAFNLKGQHLIDTLEYSVNLVEAENGIYSSRNMLQVSGLRITYNYKNTPGKRVQDVQVKCADCDIPRYLPLDKNKEYRIVTADFLANGGDGFTMLASNAKDQEKLKTDIEALVDYMNVASPITTGLEGRIKVIS
ncbi:apyrase-like [Episyrphus balteatus]|uniref:apyrase-like n=1 Tax=Episyrphus balteatus TaxID=286459 RepID=UPI00248678DD|nr:apyrase-like [Episyrphus balteatus]